MDPTNCDLSLLDILEGYIIVLRDSNPDSAGWQAALDMIQFFIKQQRNRLNSGYYIAVPPGLEQNMYVVHPANEDKSFSPVPFDSTTHAE